MFFLLAAKTFNMMRGLLSLLGVLVVEAVQDLHAGNFDDVINANENVLVHFWAPCTVPSTLDAVLSHASQASPPAILGSKKCKAFRMELERMSASDEWSGYVEPPSIFAGAFTHACEPVPSQTVPTFRRYVEHARSDISDTRGAHQPPL